MGQADAGMLSGGGYSLGGGFWGGGVPGLPAVGGAKRSLETGTDMTYAILGWRVKMDSGAGILGDIFTIADSPSRALRLLSPLRLAYSTRVSPAAVSGAACRALATSAMPPA